MQKREKEIERMYSEQWEKDRLAKAEREEMEAKEQVERNREMLEVSMHGISVTYAELQESVLRKFL